MNYSMATNWDDRLIPELKKLNFLYKDKIIELFNSLPFATAVSISKINKTKVEKKIKLIKKAGFRFNYLINSTTFPYLYIKDKRKSYEKTKEYISWITKQKVDIVTVSDKKLLSFIYKYFPGLKVNLSIVLALKNVKEINLLRKKYPNIERVTLHQAIDRDKNKLIKHIANAHKKEGLKPVKIELLANEICLYNCPLMKKHYAYSSKISQPGGFKMEKSIDKFDIWCGKIRAKDPLKFLNACWIRPEDVEIYENLGVDILKIAGKTCPTDYLIKTASSYMKRGHEGNVMDLFYSDCWPRKKKPYINNSQLNGFIEYLWSRNLKTISARDIVPKYNIKYKY